MTLSDQVASIDALAERARRSVENNEQDGCTVLPTHPSAVLVDLIDLLRTALRASPSPSAGAVPEVVVRRGDPGVDDEWNVWLFGEPDEAGELVAWSTDKGEAEKMAACLREVMRAHWPHADAGGEVTRLREERDHYRMQALRFVGLYNEAESLCNAALATGLAAVEEERTQNERIAREHPYEECRKREAFEAFLLKLVDTKGGCVVSSNDCPEWEIVAARACDRFYVDSRAYGYVIRPSARAAEREKTETEDHPTSLGGPIQSLGRAPSSSPAPAAPEARGEEDAVYRFYRECTFGPPSILPRLRALVNAERALARDAALADVVRIIELRRMQVLANSADPSWTEHFAELQDEVRSLRGKAESGEGGKNG